MHTDDRSLKDLFADLTESITTLFRKEIQLARAETSEKVTQVAVAIGAIVRLWAIGFQPHVTVDGTEYIAVAESLLAGRPLPSIFPPGYPLLIALPLALGIERVTSAALVSLVAGALLAWPVWSLARGVLGRAAALAAALVAALHPELVRFSVLSMSESAYLLALFGALAWFARGRTR